MKKSILLIALFFLLTTYRTESLNSNERKIKQLEQEIKNIKEKDINWANTIKAKRVRDLEKEIENLQSPKSNTTSSLSFPRLPKNNVYSFNNMSTRIAPKVNQIPRSNGHGTRGGEGFGTQILYGLIISLIVSAILSFIGFIYHKATASGSKKERKKHGRRLAY